jgi:hypothetical protein
VIPPIISQCFQQYAFAIMDYSSAHYPVCLVDPCQDASLAILWAVQAAIVFLDSIIIPLPPSVNVAPEIT